MQICQLAKHLGYDLYTLEDEAIRSSAEYYAPQVTNQFINDCYPMESSMYSWSPFKFKNMRWTARRVP